MGNIYCIIGKSSTGKDTIFKLLLERTDIKLKRIVSYTTRPIRSNEVEGEEYNFVTIEEKDRLLKAGKVIEIRKYDTVYGPWFYFTVDDDLDFEKNDFLTIGTVESYLMVRNYYGKDRVIPLYIEVDDGIRLERALSRERKQAEPKYEEMCRRYLADARDFSAEKLEEAQINNVFNNDDDLTKTCDKIVEFIRARS